MEMKLYWAVFSHIIYKMYVYLAFLHHVKVPGYHFMNYIIIHAHTETKVRFDL